MNLTLVSAKHFLAQGTKDGHKLTTHIKEHEGKKPIP